MLSDASFYAVLAVFLRVGRGQVIQAHRCTPFPFVTRFPLHILHLEVIGVLDVRRTDFRLRQFYSIHRFLCNHISHPMLRGIGAEGIGLCLIHTELLQVFVLDVLERNLHVVRKERLTVQPDLVNHAVSIGQLVVLIPQSRHSANQVQQHRSARHLEGIYVEYRCVATLIHSRQLPYDLHLFRTHRHALQDDGICVGFQY